MKRFFTLIIIILVLVFDSAASLIPMQDNTSSVNDEVDEDTDQQKIIIGRIIKSAYPCKCLGEECSCSFQFFSENPPNLDSGELSMVYDAVNGLSMSLKVGDSESHVIYKDITNGVDLPPLCARVPRFPLLKFCAVVYDVRVNQDIGLHICTSIENQALTTTLSAISFDCVNFSTNSVNTMAPDQHRPSFVEVHVGKSPTITFFNSVSIGVIPAIIPPVIDDSSDVLKINPT